jgi:phytoene synthase
MAADQPTRAGIDFAAVESAARTHAPDLYLSALLGARAERAGLVALAAYLGEIGRIAVQPTEAMVGIIRLQWWREAIEAGQPTGNPVADAMIDAVSRHSLPLAVVLAPLDAHDHLVTEGALSEEHELQAYIQATTTQPFALAAMIARRAGADAGEPLLASTGEAYGRVWLAARLPYFLAAGRLPLPLTRLGGADLRAGGAQAMRAVHEATDLLINEASAAMSRARPLFAAADGPTQSAILPLALVEPYLRALQKPGRDGLRQPAEISPLLRASRLWLARWRRKI